VSFLLVFAYLTATGRTRWAGRSLTLLDPTYAAKNIPIIASVSEHQPTSWSNYIMDLHVLPFFVPAGLYYCFKRWSVNGWVRGIVSFFRKSDAAFFLGVYGVLAVYFSGVMIRLLLVLAPAAACLAAVGMSSLISTFVPMVRNSPSATHEDELAEQTTEKEGAEGLPNGVDISC
jgi:dolichyl-diphosphooligosaccharide--protein glycosyltransferase